MPDSKNACDTNDYNCKNADLFHHGGETIGDVPKRELRQYGRCENNNNYGQWSPCTTDLQCYESFDLSGDWTSVDYKCIASDLLGPGNARCGCNTNGQWGPGTTDLQCYESCDLIGDWANVDYKYPSLYSLSPETCYAKSENHINLQCGQHSNDLPGVISSWENRCTDNLSSGAKSPPAVQDGDIIYGKWGPHEGIENLIGTWAAEEDATHGGANAQGSCDHPTTGTGVEVTSLMWCASPLGNLCNPSKTNAGVPGEVHVVHGAGRGTNSNRCLSPKNEWTYLTDTMDTANGYDNVQNQVLGTLPTSWE